MIVAGVMSGTSADGVNVAFVRFSKPRSSHKQIGRRSHSASLKASWQHSGIELLGHAEFPYPAEVRRMVLASMNSPSASVADLSRLNFLLGEIYADAVSSAQKKLRLKAELVGCHGQTLYHQGVAASFLGRKLAVTWQTGEGSVIAARTGIPVISDFRPADMAAGGRGAPLVPYLDYILYRDSRVGRIALNLGGIANLTAISADAPLDQIIAFDTGPGNMVIDALTEDLFKKPFDRDGKLDLAVVQNGSAGDVQILHGGGDGTFSPFGSYQIGFYTFAVGIGDFNADDQLDLAISSGGNDKVYVVLGNGDGTFQQPAPYRTGGFPSGILTADLNGDDELDLVNTNFQQRAVSVLVGNGDGTFQGHTDFPTGRSAKLVVAADLNSDGKLDLVTGDTYTNAPDISVLLGNGDATFQPPLSIAKIRGEGLVVGDFNRDGKLDLAVEDNGHVTILQTSTADRAEGKLPTVQ